MSNSSITTGAGSLSTNGPAGSMNLGIAPRGGTTPLAGVAPTVAAVNAILSRGGAPFSFSALGAGAVTAALGPLQWTQMRWKISGVLGAYGCVVSEVSADGISWSQAAAMNDFVAPGCTLSGGGDMAIAPLGGGAMVQSINLNTFPWVRFVVFGGDDSTAVTASGNIGIGAL